MMRIGFDTKFLIAAIVLLLLTWIVVMIMTGSSWWGFDTEAIERRPTPDFAPASESGREP